MEANNKSAINLTSLKELSKGDDNFVKEMVQIFIDQTPETINNLEKYMNNKDWKMVRALAHKMKPSFSFVGLQELYEILNSIEEYAESETNLDLLPEMIAKINKECTLALAELQEMVKHL